MSLQAESDLMRFNRLVLKFQDEAYTLSWYLFCSEEPAALAVQTAVLRLYRDFPKEEECFRTQLLFFVMQQGKNLRIQLPEEVVSNEASGFRLNALSCQQAQMLLLVSMMGFDYQQAARVMGCSRRFVAREIATAHKTLCARS